MAFDRRSALALALATATAFIVTAHVRAGHTNVVLSTQLSGAQEVGNGPGMAGDPNGRGEAYVFGIDGDAETLCYVLLADKIQLVPVPR